MADSIVTLNEQLNQLYRQGRYRDALPLAQQACALGLKVNAGHGLNYRNVTALFAVPHLVELNIGHSIVSHALAVGLGPAVKEMLKLLKGYKP